MINDEGKELLSYMRDSWPDIDPRVLNSSSIIGAYKKMVKLGLSDSEFDQGTILASIIPLSSISSPPATLLSHLPSPSPPSLTLSLTL